MSRFDKALERAKETPTDGTTPFEVMLPDEAPSPEVFTPPWKVVDRPVQTAPVRPARSPRAAAAAEPPAAPPVLHLHAEVVEKTVADSRIAGPILEQYRKLAGSLHQWQNEHGGKVVAVVSAVSSEGKTLTALNLALTLSGSYQRRVLLVDCDLRRPMLHEALQVAELPGIAEAATGQGARIVPVTAGLALVQAGHLAGDPVGALTSAGVTALIEQGRGDYDWVVIDTPPAAVVPDAGLLNDQVDGAVLVVAAGSTSFDMVTRAVAAIGRDRILGVVLNGVDPRDITTGEYHDYYAQR